MQIASILNQVATYLMMLDGGVTGNTGLVRWVAGGLALVILVVLVQRRRTRVK